MRIRDEIKNIKDKVGVYLKAGRHDTAEKLLKATLAEYGALANIHNLLGVTYHGQSRFPEALEQFQNALRSNGTFLEAGLNLVAAHCDVGNYNEAAKIYSSLEATNKSSTQAPKVIKGRMADLHSQLGNMYAEHNMNNEAIVEYKKALALFERLPDVKINLARLYIKLSKFHEAKTQLEELMNILPTSPEPRVWLGVLAFKTGNPKEARSYWERAYQLEPNNPSARAYFKLVSAWNTNSPK